MNEHEKLYKIIKTIGYEINRNLYYIPKLEDGFEIWLNNYISEPIVVNVREIIFTQEFMDKLIDYRINWKIKAIPCKSLKDTFYSTLMENLNNPVDYIFNILELG